MGDLQVANNVYEIIGIFDIPSFAQILGNPPPASTLTCRCHL